jgi:hypothetical protein
MQPDIKLLDDTDLIPADDQIEEDTVSPAGVGAVLPFPSIATSKKVIRQTPIADRAALEQRRQMDMETSSEAEIAAVNKREEKREEKEEQQLEVRDVNSAVMAELDGKPKDHPLYAWQRDLDKKVKKITDSGGQPTEDMMCQRAGLMAAWKYAKKGRALECASAGYVAAREMLARIKADRVREPDTGPQSKFDPAKGTLEGYLYTTARFLVMDPPGFG